jgi:hypothetical protein
MCSEEESLSGRVRDLHGVILDDVQCEICHDLLWKPISCDMCESLFCAAGIRRWLAENPNKCPNRCESFVEHKCPRFVRQQLARLQLACKYEATGCTQVRNQCSRELITRFLRVFRSLAMTLLNYMRQDADVNRLSALVATQKWKRRTLFNTKTTANRSIWYVHFVAWTTRGATLIRCIRKANV